MPDISEPLKLAKMDEILEIEDSRIQIAELDDVSRWIELAISNIGAFARYSKELLALEEYFYESGIDGDDLHLWRAYRNLFAQRFAGVYDDILKVTDIVAFDLFNYFINHPRLIDAKSRFATGAVPFTFLGRTEDYYYTYTHELERPIAVISIPQGRLSSVWNWLAIPHEIGHNIFAHFIDYEKELWSKIQPVLNKAKFNVNKIRFASKVSGRRIIQSIWHFWLDETMADILGVLFTGPAFVMSRQEDALQAAEQMGLNVAIWDVEDMMMTKHPIAYLRPLLASEVLRTLGFKEEANLLDQRWCSIFPNMSCDPQLLWIDDRPAGREELFIINLDEMMRSFRMFIDIILYEKMNCLNDSALIDIVRFDNPDYVISRVVAEELLHGASEFARYVKPRHILAASRIAFESEPSNADQIHASAIKGIIHFNKHHSD